MTGFNLGMAIEVVVAVLLVLTITYCIILNRRLTRLRADEEVLRATIAELITATEIAERAILGLKATAGECEKSLGARLVKAEATILDLDRQIAAGSEIVRRIGAIVSAAMPQASAMAGVAAASAATAPEMAATAAATAQPGRDNLARSLQSAAQEAAERLAAYRKSSREEAA